MVKLIRTDSSNQHFIELVKLLDTDLAIRDGEDHAFYNQFNSIGNIKYAVVAFDENIAVGCGALKEFDSTTHEVKRMFVLPASRGKGIASLILTELEKWTAELGYEKCKLETGKNQPEAIKLYLKNGYKIIPNYGQYVGIENSVCFEKDITINKE